MDSASIRRQSVALIAAYALALQGLLLAFGPATPTAVAGPFAVLCSQANANADGAGHPQQHERPCVAVCAALGLGVTAPPPAQMAVAFAVPQARSEVVPSRTWIPAGAAVRGPQAPRAPPLT